MEDASARSHSSSLSLIISEVGLISGIDDIKQDSVPAVVPPPPPPRYPAKQRTISDSAPACPRLASLTELLMMNQKTAAPMRGNSTSPDSSPSIGRCFASSASASATLSSSSDLQTPSPAVRTSSRSDEEDAETGRAGGGGSTDGGAHRRSVAAAAALTLSTTTTTDPSPSGAVFVVETDLRRLVFHHSRAKRLVSGLRVHAFTRQAFVSSFTVGLALGSVIAILLKILRDLTHRMLYG